MCLDDYSGRLASSCRSHLPFQYCNKQPLEQRRHALASRLRRQAAGDYCDTSFGDSRHSSRHARTYDGGESARTPTHRRRDRLPRLLSSVQPKVRSEGQEPLQRRLSQRRSPMTPPRQLTPSRAQLACSCCRRRRRRSLAPAVVTRATG